MTKALTKAAGKLNKPATRKYEEIWSIMYLYQYFYDVVPSTYAEWSEQLVCVLRGFCGWRSADLVGITRTSGIRFLDDGSCELRFFGGKVGQESWSGWSSFPKLSPTFVSLCIPSIVRAMLDVSADFSFTKVHVRDQFGAESLDSPLFTHVRADKKTGLHKPWKEGTIKQKCKKAFFDNVEFVDGVSLHDHGFGTHSVRHAVASFLSLLQVPIDLAAKHAQTSSISMDSTYVIPVRQDGWEIPSECVANAHSLVHKLLVPFAHYVSSKDGGPCSCDTIVVGKGNNLAVVPRN